MAAEFTLLRAHAVKISVIQPYKITHSQKSDFHEIIHISGQLSFAFNQLINSLKVAVPNYESFQNQNNSNTLFYHLQRMSGAKC